MSDIRSRLADALREAVDDVLTPDIGPVRQQNLVLHVTRKLLSLPGIAIVELPEPVGDDIRRSWRFLDHGEYEHVTWPSHLYPEDDISVSGIGGFSVSEARAFAAALLAAAVQAQEEK